MIWFMFWFWFIQVRLSQFVDSAIIWKKGSLLHKNNHQALLKQLRGSTVEVRVQGRYPENFLFLVHETFEMLIMEAYNGVTYDFLVPCVDCIKVVSGYKQEIKVLKGDHFHYLWYTFCPYG